MGKTKKGKKDRKFLEGTAIAAYLEPDVEPVLLPKKHTKEDRTFPTLVLDGASGVGKTQQFFSLTKNGETAAYLLMTDLGQRPQPVYQELVQNLGGHHMGLINAAMQGIIDHAQREKKETEDLFSTEELFAIVYQTDILHDLMFYLHDGQVQFDKTSKKLCKCNEVGGTFNVLDFEGKVLFVDEALPWVNHTDEDKDSHDKLRFIRNFGRALGMRVVLAGTAATAANMLTVYKESAVSRKGDAEVGWVECEYLWRPISSDGLKKLFSQVGDEEDIMSDETGTATAVQWGSICAQLQAERPLLAVYLEQIICKTSRAPTDEEIPELLPDLGKKLQSNKGRAFKEGQLIWLSGAWLRGQHVAPSPLPLEAPELVKSHFFEPAITTRKPHKLKPYHGYGFAEVDYASSPLRLSITKHGLANGGVMWSIAASDDPRQAIGKGSSDTAALCHKFGGVAYALKHVVQQCLATEPILAVALSSTNVEGNRYEDLTPKAWKETKVQHTMNQVCGEVNEHICFTALQVCSRSKKGFPNPANVMDFCQNFSDLAKPPDTWEANVAEAIRHLWKKEAGLAATKVPTKLKPSFSRPKPSLYGDQLTFLHSLHLGTDLVYIPNVKRKGVDKEEGEEGEKEFMAKRQQRQKFEKAVGDAWDAYVDGTKEETKKLCEETMLPWLVPACSAKELKKKIEASPDLFNNLNIAGLVPGEDKQSPFDASAYRWNKNAPREWLFEFKTRQKEYSSAAGVRDLEQKIANEKKKQTQGGCNDGDPHHAMLIAIRGEGDSEMHAWRNGDGFLRVVLLVRDLVLDP